MNISEVYHHDTEGNILWQASDLHNTFHNAGEEFFLKALFTQIPIPNVYYIGLDNRLTIHQNDTASDLVGEPTGGGYTRVSLDTSTSFGATFTGVNWEINSVTVFFTATATLPTVRNAFLTTATGNSGYLLSSVPLLSTRTLTAGQSISFRFVLGLGV